MLLKRKGTESDEDFENKLIIEKWIKRNSSSKVTIGQNIIKANDSFKAPHISVAKNLFPTKTALNVSKTSVIKQIFPTPECSNIKRNIFVCKKRSNDCSSEKIELSISKVYRQSLPMHSSDFQKVGKSSLTQIVTHKSELISKSKTLMAKAPYLTDTMKPATAKSMVKKYNVPTTPNVKCSPTKLDYPLKKEIQKEESDANFLSNIKNILYKDNDSDVYANLLENYRYLITPKSWSVTEFTNETKDRYIVFFNHHVIQENNTLISVMKKSLIIDKGAKMNYSVHGLAVNINGTILPKILDNTKKLLSILHIFDKMQVCEGLGNDLNIMQTDFVFKDNCRYWRHKHCKIVLIKATRCPICSDTRSIVLKRNIICGNKPFDSSEYIGVQTELDHI